MADLNMEVRSRSPAETLEWLGPHLKRVGITRMAEVTSLDELGIPVVEAHRPDAKCVTVSMGKGLHKVQAQVSAFMEGIEYFHLEELSTSGPRASVREMEPHLSYSLEELHLQEPNMLHQDIVLYWVEATTILTRRSTYVPLSYLKLDASDMSWTPPLFSASSEGVAGGNTLEEAVVQGLYEVIERDCESEASRIPDGGLPEIDPASIPDGFSRALAQRYRDANSALKIMDITNDLGVPTYLVHAWSPAMRMMHTGSGTHQDPDVALGRALVEAAQIRLATITGMRDDLPAHLWQQPAYTAGESPTAIPAHTSADQAPHGRGSADPIIEAARLAGLIASRTGTEPILVDLTRPDLKIPVTRVIAPGLRSSQQQ